MSLIQQNNTLSLFCDGSLSRSKYGTMGCAGALPVIFDGRPIILYPALEILKNTTNNETEIAAIYLGILSAICIRDKCNIKCINLYSDSKISIFGLKKWIFEWMKNKSDNILYTESGKPVANQRIFKSIILEIIHNEIEINFYHQKGHVKEQNLEQAMTVFNNSNDTNISDTEIIKEISFYNNMIDELTRKQVQDFVKMKEYEKDNVPELIKDFNETLEFDFDINKFKKLINQ